VANDRFGIGVALSGDTAVVGAPTGGASDGGGSVYVYTRSGTTWTEKAILPVGIAGERGGWRVDLEGDTLLVSAPTQWANGGIAWVYQGAGATWSRAATLTAPAGASGDSFGTSVTLRGDEAFIGAPLASGAQGAVHVYSRAGGSWSHTATITAPGAANGDDFGVSLAVRGERLLVGSPGIGTHTGAAFLFERSGSTWSPVATLTAGPGAVKPMFGNSVSISDAGAFVGAPTETLGRGAAYVFAGPSWSRVATLTSSTTYYSGDFGWSVLQWGDTLLVGDPAADSGNGVVHFLRTPVYATPEGVPLTVAAPDGVLANDRADRPAVSLVTTQATAPGHGTLVLASDGGFVYTPEPGFAGVDTFTYRAYDGYLLSAPAIGSITVTPGTMRVPVSPYAARRGRTIQVYGVTPHRHRAGTYPVVLDCYRLENGEWVLRKSVPMKAYRYPRRTKYGRWLTLPSKGRWRLIARDTEDGVTRYSTPRYMRVW
jgi:hypothetical protein